MTDDFPRRRAATRGFRLGAPRDVHVLADGASVLYLRSRGPRDAVNHLWRGTWESGSLREDLLVDASSLLEGGVDELPAAERAKRERARDVGAGLTGFSVDARGGTVAFSLSGAAYVLALATQEITPAIGSGSLANVSIDPTGTRVAATDGGALVVADRATRSVHRLREPEHSAHTWGSPEFIAAEEFDRTDGYWWAPDGSALLVAEVDESAVATWYLTDPGLPGQEPSALRYPAAGSANATVRLHVVRLDGSSAPVAWEHTTHEYMCWAHWSQHGLVIATLNRAQTELVVHRVDPATGACEPLDVQRSETWIDVTPGIPRLTASGLVTTRVDLANDSRRACLVAHGEVVARTPLGLHVRGVLAEDNTGLLLSASDGDPASSGLWHWSPEGALTSLGPERGWAAGTMSGGTVVVTAADLAAPAAATTIRPASGEAPLVIPTLADVPPVRPRPEFIVEDGWSRIAILWPERATGDPLPILLVPYGGPHAQRSIHAAAAFVTEQWFANQGFCVVVADGPGTGGRPRNERLIHHDLAGPGLHGQVSALEAVEQRHRGRVDPSRVGIMGWSFGGYLAALAVLERPDLFHAAVAGALVSEWRLYDTAYTERYLGMPDGEQGAYDRSSLIPRADRLERPLLLIHGTNDDNVFFAHALQLSGALLAAGKEHDFLPLSGVTHMAPQEVIAENLLLRQLDFLRRHLHTPVLG